MKHAYRITVIMANQEGQTVVDEPTVVASDIFEAAEKAQNFARYGAVESIVCIDNEIRRKKIWKTKQQ